MNRHFPCNMILGAVHARIVLLLFGLSVFTIEGFAQSLLGEWKTCSFESPKPDELVEITLYSSEAPSCTDSISDYTITTFVFSIEDGKNKVTLSTKTVFVDNGPPYTLKAASNYVLAGEWVYSDNDGTISFLDFNNQKMEFEIILVSKTLLKLKRNG